MNKFRFSSNSKGTWIFLNISKTRTSRNPRNMDFETKYIPRIIRSKERNITWYPCHERIKKSKRNQTTNKFRFSSNSKETRIFLNMRFKNENYFKKSSKYGFRNQIYSKNNSIRSKGRNIIWYPCHERVKKF